MECRMEYRNEKKKKKWEEKEVEEGGRDDEARRRSGVETKGTKWSYSYSVLAVPKQHKAVRTYLLVDGYIS